VKGFSVGARAPAKKLEIFDEFGSATQVCTRTNVKIAVKSKVNIILRRKKISMILECHFRIETCFLFFSLKNS